MNIWLRLEMSSTSWEHYLTLQLHLGISFSLLKQDGPQQAKISAYTNVSLVWNFMSKRKFGYEALAKAKFEIFEEAKSKLFFDVKATYFNLVSLIKKQLELQLENIAILTSFKGLANIKIESGSCISC